ECEAPAPGPPQCDGPQLLRLWLWIRHGRRASPQRRRSLLDTDSSDARRVRRHVRQRRRSLVLRSDLEELRRAVTRGFLALGDSYTIGEGVSAAERWPAQLVAMARSAGLALGAPQISAGTGRTTPGLLA